MSNCTCGKTTRPPFCDGSHWLSDEEYKQRTEKLNNLFKKESNNVNTTIQFKSENRLSKS